MTSTQIHTEAVGNEKRIVSFKVVTRTNIRRQDSPKRLAWLTQATHHPLSNRQPDFQRK